MDITKAKELLEKARREARDGCRSFDPDTGVGGMFGYIEELIDEALKALAEEEADEADDADEADEADDTASCGVSISDHYEDPTHY